MALAPCVIGYAEIATWLSGEPYVVRDGNPYAGWIEMYASDEFQQAAAGEKAWLNEHLKPKGVGVVIEAEHLCMSVRGVRSAGTSTVTSALHGLLRDRPESRAEFLALATTGVHQASQPPGSPVEPATTATE